MLDVLGLESQVENAIAHERIPGLALAIVQNGRTVYARGFGVTCVEPHGQPVTPETLFRIGSVTKPLTGTLVMRLVDEGKLDLDTTVREYVPWFKTSDAKATRRITPRLLLSHTSGLPHDHKPSGPRGDDALERRIREEVPRYALVAPPGTKFSYSNTGIHVLAFLIETLTGKRYAQAMQELLFEPLGMRHTTFLPAVALTYPCALGHRLTPRGKLEVEHHFAENVANYASGQAISTVLDLARFAMLHMDGGRIRRTRLLSKDAVAEMHRPHAQRGLDSPYGLTFGVREYKGLTRVSHGGAIANFGAVFSMAMQPATAVIVLFNRLPGNPSIGQLVDRVFDAVLDLPA